ncbi:phasin family protein, partial [Micromonospora ureilytica]
MQDAWRAYLELAMGLAEAPRKKAQDVARRLVGSGGATAAQLQALGEELVTTGAANREALTKLVRFEVDRALGAVGLATADEVAELTRRVHDLERQLREARSAEPAAGPTAQPASAVAARPG